MKVPFVKVLFLLSLCINVHAQEDTAVRNTLDRIISHTQEASLYRNQVDWDTLKPRIYAMAQNANSVPELSDALSFLLKSLGDEHGRIFHNFQIIANYYGEQKPHQKAFQLEIYNQVQMGQVYPFHAQMLEGGIGYIRIVGLPMGDNEKMASDLQEKVCDLMAKGAEQWIIDLRYNGGGNMHPMAEGIAAIIGEGATGGSKGLTEVENSNWGVENGDFYYDDYSIQLENNCTINGYPKVAVLTSLYTASSGEAMAVIFKGRKNTRFFGNKTIGLVTVTDWTVIDESTAMTISVSYYKDRNGKVYDKYVEPDVEVPFAQQPISTEDEGIRMATAWLLE